MKLIFKPALTVIISAFLMIPVISYAEHHAKMEEKKATSLDAILSAQDQDVQARFAFRHPRQTIEFFGIEPGMKVLEALPGGGWYTKILLPYLGQDGHILGVDYDIEMWSYFGGFADEVFLEKKKSWPETWAGKAQAWRGEHDASVSAATFSTIPAESEGTLDAVLFIRAMHNLARFSDKGNYLGDAIDASFRALKPGGIAGIVQHEARQDRPDDWANGSNGYLKKSMLIAAMEKGGFEFMGESDINSNAKDLAGEGDMVWRLPPTFATSGENQELKAKMVEIGESNRMTLKFRKPINQE